MSEQMSQIQVKCTDQVLKIVKAPVIASGGLNEVSVVFDFCAKWDGFVKTALFYRDAENVYYAVLDDNDTCTVPWEVCYEDGYFFFSVFGERGNTRRTSNKNRYKVVDGAISEGFMPSDPTPDVYDQIMALIGETKEISQTFREGAMEVVNEAAGIANTAAKNANEAAGNAQDAAANANEATVKADQAKATAEVAAANANKAATAANNAKTAADTATAKADAATVAANNAASVAETATEETIAARESFLETAGETMQTITDLIGNAEDAPAIVCEKTGSTIAVNDASNRLLQDLTLYGKTTQVTTTGKNLFGGDALADKLVECGATKDAENGTVRLLGSQAHQQVLFDSFKENTQYTFIFDVIVNGTGTPLNVEIAYTDGTYTRCYVSTAGTKETIAVVSNSGKTIASLRGVNTTNTTYYYDKCGVFEGVVTVDDFEPYTGGAPSPSQDYPQELVSVGAGGSINTTVGGKNLIPNQYLTGYAVGQNSAGVVVYASDGRSAVADILLLPGTYTLSGPDLGYVYLHDEKRNPKGYKNAATIPYTFTVAESTYFSFHCATTHEGKCQLERGAVATEFEPYKGQTLTASTPNGLPGIPVSSGGNYTDENGQQWICDEVDFARGVYVQRIETATASGDESWYKINDSTGGIRVSAIDYFKNKLLPISGGTTNALCSHFRVGATVPGFYQGGNDSVSFFAPFATVDEWKNFLAQQYNTGTPLITMGVLAEPIETPLSAEELAQYAALHTNKPNTTVYNDAGAGMKLEYTADTKTYIDNKFTELANAIVSNA